MDKIILFRVPTCELLDELANRIQTGSPANFEGISSKELLEHIITERMNSFRC